jgi:predicted flap endonuclease-1-like 5' DNA nuclease
MPIPMVSLSSILLWALGGVVIGLLLGWLIWRRPARKQTRELASQLAAREEQLRATEQALGAAQRQAQSLAESLSAYYTRLTEAYKRITDLQNELVGLRNTHHELQARMETQIAAARAGKEVRDVELEQLRTTAAELRAGLEFRQAENTDLHHRLEAVLAARTELEGILAQRTRELEAVSRQLAALQDELEAARLNRRGLEATLSQRMTELAALQTQIDTLEHRLRAYETATAPLPPEAAAAATVALAAEVAAAPVATTPIVAEAVALAEQASPETVPTWDAAAFKARVAAASPEAGVSVRQQAWPQDLEAVQGIGRGFAARLYRAGIGTFWELVHLSNAELLAILQPSELQRRRMDPDAIRHSALSLAQMTDTVGLLWSGTRADDFLPLPGLGKVFARRLYEAGILTYEDLAHQTPEQLAAVCGVPPGGRLDYEAWIAEARRRLATADADTEHTG